MANYYMLGGDGKEYGPVSTEQLRQWLTEKRANAKTQIRTDKSASWVALGTVPEFSFATAASAASPAPVIGPASGASLSDSSDAVKRLALALASSAGWMRWTAILVFIMSGLFIFETIGIGLLIAWLPIWFGLILNRAASQARRAAATGTESDLLAVFAQLRAFFKLTGVLTIILLIFALLMIVIIQIVGSQIAGLAGGGNMDDMLKSLQNMQGK